MSLLESSALAYAQQVSLLKLIELYFENPSMRDVFDKLDFFKLQAWDRPPSDFLEVLATKNEDCADFMIERIDWWKVFKARFGDLDGVPYIRYFHYRTQEPVIDIYNFCIRMFRSRWFKASVNLETLQILKISPCEAPQPLLLETQEKESDGDVIQMIFSDYADPLFARAKGYGKIIPKTHVLISRDVRKDKIFITHVGNVDILLKTAKSIIDVVLVDEELYGVSREEALRLLENGEIYDHKTTPTSSIKYRIFELPS